jgi:hypothetical protein
MAKPVPHDGAAALTELARGVRAIPFHTHPGIVNDPETITGSRSSPAAILEQLLGALDAAGIIIDDTTD